MKKTEPFLTRLILLFLISTFLMATGKAQNPTIIPLYRNIQNEEKACRDELHTFDTNGKLTHIAKVKVPRLMVYQPDNPCGTGIIICPGGGYSRLNVENTRFVAERLNKFGVTVFVLVYRLPADYDSPEKSVVALQDVQESFRLVRQRASEWKLAANQLGLWGASAGGHLAAMAATHFTTSFDPGKDTTGLRPDFLVLTWPVISAHQSLAHKGSIKNILGEQPNEKQIAWYSPEEWISKSTPVTFLVHASDDTTVSSENSIVFYKGLKKYRVPAELHIYEKGGHGFGIAPDIQDSWVSQLIIWLKNRGLI